MINADFKLFFLKTEFSGWGGCIKKICRALKVKPPPPTLNLPYAPAQRDVKRKPDLKIISKILNVVAEEYKKKL